MRIYNLFEGKENTVGIIFGRFNPPHKGHVAAWELASQNDEWYVSTNPSTVGPKDPLPLEVKKQAMFAMMPEIKNHFVTEQSWLTLAAMVYKKHGSVSLIVYTDEDWVTKTLQKYNGDEGAHGKYAFKDIIQHPTPRLSSATDVREAVLNQDPKAFEKATGVPASTKVGGKSYFDVVSEYLLPYKELIDAKAKKARK